MGTKSAGVAALLGAAALVGCGSDKTVTVNAVFINTERVERAIERSALQQRRTSAQVSCPAGTRQKKGNTFKCTARTRSGTTTFTVRQTDDAGHVTYTSP